MTKQPCRPPPITVTKARVLPVLAQARALTREEKEVGRAERVAMALVGRMWGRRGSP